MTKFLSKRLIRIFFYSFIWITVPATVLLIPDMYEKRVEAGKHLTPYSVSVRGYYRKDGTYVRPHSRRPPGSVAHDAPYKSKSFRLFWGMTGLILLSLGSTGGLVLFSYNEIKDRKRNHKTHIESDLLSGMNTDFTDLVDKPRHLINRLISRHDTYKTYNCISCKRAIGREEFHYSSMATRNPSKTCIDCMTKNKERFDDELTYAWYFEERLIDFLGKFEKMNKTYYPKTIIQTKNIESFFYESVKQLRKKTATNNGYKT
jgi:hypothetical protein